MKYTNILSEHFFPRKFEIIVRLHFFFAVSNSCLDFTLLVSGRTGCDPEATVTVLNNCPLSDQGFRRGGSVETCAYASDIV